MINESMINKIRALMAKTSDNGCTPDEAEAAAAKVAELMELYHIQESDVVTKEDKNKNGFVLVKYGHFEPWTVSLTSTVARMTGCFALLSGNRAVFYGTEFAVDAAMFAMNNLQEQAAKMAFKYWSDNHLLYDECERNRVIRDYRLGIVHGIRNRVAEQQRQQVHVGGQLNAGSTTGLMVINNAISKAEEYASTVTMWSKTRRSGGSVSDYDAYDRGRKDSANVTTQQRLK